MSSKLTWYINRLKAMTLKEVSWRFFQKISYISENHKFCREHVMVCDEIFSSKLKKIYDAYAGRILRPNSLGLLVKPNKPVDTDIALLGNYKYNDYKTDWHAGFQTAERWPSDVASNKLSYKQRDDIGDARTNWELNRHYQFAALAAAFSQSGDKKYLLELETLFDDWNAKNPFLMGISWTSEMEIAIRLIQWTMASFYLSSGSCDCSELRRKLEIGAINMAWHVERHYSRYSSANNHLLVEAAALVAAGKAFNHKPWIDLGMWQLNEQLPLQFYSDGVNKEMSLHYQAFAMEAYTLALLVIEREIPEWVDSLQRQCEFVASSLSSGTAVEFGDSDDGKILFFTSPNHYHRVLQLLSLFLPFAYVRMGPDSYVARFLDADIVNYQESKCLWKGDEFIQTFPHGGYTYMRDRGNRVLIAIDHAPLGFGSIAAHGHADALSFQLLVDGKPIFTDPGTYIYHCYLPERNAFRRTINHNTICVGNADQSEMLGAFLWGRKAEAWIDDVSYEPEKSTLTVSHNGYSPIVHTRKFTWNNSNLLCINDSLSQRCEFCSTLVLGKGLAVEETQNGAFIMNQGQKVCKVEWSNNSADKIECVVEPIAVSTAYGVKEQSLAIRLLTVSNNIALRISLYF